MFPLISGQHEMGPSIEKHIYPLQPKNEHIFIYIIPKTDGMGDERSISIERRANRHTLQAHCTRREPLLKNTKKHQRSPGHENPTISSSPSRRPQGVAGNLEEFHHLQNKKAV